MTRLSFSSASAAHLRLAAALALIKIAQHSAFNEMIDNNAFEEICFTTQDVYFVVRRDLFGKYRKYISKKRHQSRWYIIPFLCAHDPEAEIREMVSTVVRLTGQALILYLRAGGSFAT